MHHIHSALLTLSFLFFVIPVWGLQNPHEVMQRGIVHLTQADFPTAMRYFTRSMLMAENQRDTMTLLQSMGYIANVYYNTGDYNRASLYLLKGYRRAVEFGDKELQSRMLTNLVTNLAKCGKTEDAKFYFELLKRTPSNDRPDWLYYVKYDRARIATAEKHYDEALGYHRATLEFALTNKLPLHYVDFQNCEMADLYLKKEDADNAVRHARLCISNARKRNDRDLLTSVYQILADAYELQAKADSTRKYRSLYLALSDTLFNSKRIYRADDELIEYENQRHAAHINLLGRTINRQTYVITIFTLLLVALLLLILLLFRYNQRLRWTQRLLISKEKEIGTQEAYKKALLEELVMRHRHKTSDITNDSITINANDPSQNSEVVLSVEQSRILAAKVMEVMSQTDVISDPDFSLSKLAELIDSNFKYVSMVINSTYNKNFKTLLNEYRIREACKRLVDTENYGNITIQGIFQSVGYTNATSFNRSFKKVTGMTPTEYLRLQSKL